MIVSDEQFEIFFPEMIKLTASLKEKIGLEDDMEAVLFIAAALGKGLSKATMSAGGSKDDSFQFLEEMVNRMKSNCAEAWKD